MKKLLEASQFEGAVKKLADDIARFQKDFTNVAFVGIHTRGIPLSNRLVKVFKAQDKPVLEGMLDINLYRDDLSLSAEQPIVKETKINFDLDGKVVYLCDDVLYTGRTVRAAMDALFDLGRPKAIHLVVFARRNGRELPIESSFHALDVDTKPTDNVKVKFAETDGKDDVTMLEAGEY
jgi:pyrimidine operon attenuation protein/uracil phosphoribosyltransferase